MSYANNNSTSDDNESQVGSEEYDSLENFKIAVRDLEQDEKTLLRFLRAREYDLPKAEDMIRKSVQWRQENDIASYVNYQPPKYLEKEFNITYHITGPDNDGRPVVYIPIGSFLAKESIEAGHKDELFKWVYYMLEAAMSSLRESGHSQVVALLALENLTMRQICHMDTMHVVYKAFQILEANYPEIMKNFFIVNAPWIFSIAYNFVKPILSQHTISKLQVFDSNKSKWLPRLLDLMPIESVPERYLDD